MKKYFMKEISIEYHMDKAKQCYILLISNIEERYKRVRQKGGEYWKVKITNLTVFGNNRNPSWAFISSNKELSRNKKKPRKYFIKMGGSIQGE